MAHFLRRAGFGATHDELEAYAARGYEAAVEELLHPESQTEMDEDLMMRLNPGWQILSGVEWSQSYWLYRMIHTKRPLEEKIALFWHSVHCTGEAKVAHAWQMAITVDMFRRHGLGSFRDLLSRLGGDPGMIYFLDNNMNHKGAINENWGRELLELFSMGVGNYGEDDVKEAARAFTGWNIAPSMPLFPYGRTQWQFLYDPTDHDSELKSFLGRTGRFNGEDIVDVICQQPSTAYFIARHLYNFFVADEEPVSQWPHVPPRDPNAIQTLVDAYFQHDCDIRSVLRVLFNSDFFKSAQYARIRNPTEVVVGTARLLKGYDMPGGEEFIGLQEECGFMGMELMNPPTVEGWHTGKDWIDSGTLVERINFVADQLGDVSKPGVREIVDRLAARGNTLKPEELVAGCSEELGFVGLTDETRKLLGDRARAEGEIDTGSDDFARRTAEVLRLICATKEYQFG